MKIAIIGAGLSGLACAIELKRKGITPTVFERKGYCGQGFNCPVINLRIFNRTFRSPVKYFKQKYNLKLIPWASLHKQTVIGSKKQFISKGNLGYLYRKGEDKLSLENQLAAYINFPIAFDRYVSIEDIKGLFDFIVVATGDCRIAKSFNNIWTGTFNCFTRVATVLGNFETNSVKVWINTEYAKNCSCFLVAVSKEQGYIVMTVNNIAFNELEHYWKIFLQKEGINAQIVEISDHEQNIGYTTPVQFENIYFAGNPAGMVDDLFGFGAFNSIESGILTARAIAESSSYSELLLPIRNDVKVLHEYRKAFNVFENKDFDRLLSLISLPLVKQFIYNNPLYKAKTAAFLASIYNKLPL